MGDDLLGGPRVALQPLFVSKKKNMIPISGFVDSLNFLVPFKNC